MKKRKLKKWVIPALAVTIIVLTLIVVGFIIATINIANNSKKNEEELMNNYISCLNENFTQRDYCAKKLDNLLKANGYIYKQKGYDLYLTKVGVDNE